MKIIAGDANDTDDSYRGGSIETPSVHSWKLFCDFSLGVWFLVS